MFSRRGEEVGGRREPFAAANIPADRSVVQAHFQRAVSILRAKFADVPGLNPAGKGSLKEAAVEEFFGEHVPGSLSVGQGYVLFAGTPSSQQDVVVFENRGLVLPIGPIRMVVSDSVVACVEVKSTLTKEGLLGSIADSIRRFPHPRPLMVVVAGRLEDHGKYRRIVRKWVEDEGQSLDDFPDLITVLDVGTIVCRGRLRSLKAREKQLEFDDELLKYGAFESEIWSGPALAVFEIAARAENVDWGDHLFQVLPETLTKVERYSA